MSFRRRAQRRRRNLLSASATEPPQTFALFAKAEPSITDPRPRVPHLLFFERWDSTVAAHSRILPRYPANLSFRRRAQRRQEESAFSPVTSAFTSLSSRLEALTYFDSQLPVTPIRRKRSSHYRLGCSAKRRSDVATSTRFYPSGAPSCVEFDVPLTSSYHLLQI